MTLPGIGPSLPTLNLKKLETLAIQQALQQTGGDVRRASEILGIGRTTLYRRIKENDPVKALENILKEILPSGIPE